jgi:hypothetical protein
MHQYAKNLLFLGPGTQQLILGSRGDTENKWSNLGNCSASELAKRKKPQKFPRRFTPAAAEKLGRIAKLMTPCLPPSIEFNEGWAQAWQREINCSSSANILGKEHWLLLSRPGANENVI